MGSSGDSYLIIGAGVFGASTALDLKKSFPTRSVRVIDRTVVPCPSAASHDLSKIVRADYADPFYMKLGLQAMEEWRSNPIYRPSYHESGLLITADMGWGANCLENYKLLKADVSPEMLKIEDVLARFPIFSEANWDGATQCYWNPASGWAEADKAMSSCLKAAHDTGVEFIEATIDKLLVDGDGVCTGVRAADGTEYGGTHVILCTGAYTAKLLLDTFPHSEDFQVGNRMVAAGAISCSASFDAADEAKMKDVPVLINTMPHTHGESVPPLNDGTLKFNHELSFTNNTLHESSGKTISIPPSRETQSIWSQDVPQTLKDEVATVVKNIYGTVLKGLKVEQYRMCWDAVTPDQDWVISPHPKCENLYIATAGSFHSWKFLPVLGSYVTRMVHGELEEEKSARWAWDRRSDGSACLMYIPTRDLKDL